MSASSTFTPISLRLTPPTTDPVSPKIFRSSLIDTVKTKVELTLSQVEKLHASCLKHDRYSFRVPGAFSGCGATIFSRPDQPTIYIEGGPRFLTGQNILGIENMLQMSSELSLAVLERAGIRINDSQRQQLEEGLFQLLRVDVAAHCTCGSPEQLRAVMEAIRRLAVNKARDVSFYGRETVYIGQHSKRRTFKVYNKGAEVGARPIPEGVYTRNALMQVTEGLLRFEFTLRAEELRRLGLASPLTWTPATGRAFLQRNFDFMTRVDGVVPNIVGAGQLTPSCRAKLRAYVLGDVSAFDGAPTMYDQRRREILRVTGIDISSPFALELQRDAVLSVRNVLRDGLGFKAHPKAWKRLRAAAVFRSPG